MVEKKVIFLLYNYIALANGILSDILFKSGLTLCLYFVYNITDHKSKIFVIFKNRYLPDRT